MLRKKITFDSFVRSVLICILIAGIIYLMSILSGVLTPFFVGWLIAYLMFPLVKFLQYRCRLKYRILSIVCAFVIVAAVLWGGFALIVPPMVDEAVKVKDMLVNYISNDATIASIPSVLQEYVKDNLNAEQLKVLLTQDGFISGVKSALPQIGNILSQSIGLVSGLLSVTMIILYTLFILIDYERFSGGWVELLPHRIRQFSQQVVSDITDGMNKYFRGQALVALCVGILFSIGFLIIDFPLAIGLGLFIGLLNMVPYLQTVGFIPTILLAIVKSAETGQDFWIVMLLALAVFGIVQTIQDTFLVPKIMGNVTGLNSAVILLSLSVWGALLGVLGMVIALPLTTLLLNYYQRYILQKKETASPAVLPQPPVKDEQPQNHDS
ncbi:MAG: AI-2E family transporter [Bacteroidales bacterium]|nr:AI-2E family transporter [Bacteroidales bacterium]